MSVAPRRSALALQTYRLTKRFGSFTALDEVTISVRPGTVHALLGENGAGKSTLVKCLAGYHLPDDGAILLDDREREIRTPADARHLGIGMVYQHFTVVPGMTVAENLLLARGKLPALVSWRQRRPELQAFMESAPFQLDLDAMPSQLSAGEKQKLEILKQLFLQPRLLVLDEPTSVLTPLEADEVLGTLRERAHAGRCTVVLITHKFREVSTYADEVSVLRRGRHVGGGHVAEMPTSQMATLMVGDLASTTPSASVTHPLAKPAEAQPPAQSDHGAGEVRLTVQGLRVRGDRGEWAVDGLDLTIRAGEIVGLAGVSGNGQRELMQVLVGQRPKEGGVVQVDGQPFRATRGENRQRRVRSLPEEPLRNACVPGMSVAENMALRDFDQAPYAWRGWRRPAAVRQRARERIQAFGVRTRGEFAPIESLSGGNVQRAVLARELVDDVALLLVSNPSFGLDFHAVAEVHERLRQVRGRGCAVLMVSEDLDELLGVADRLLVMSRGRIVHACPCREARRAEIGRHMGGGHD